MLQRNSNKSIWHDVSSREKTVTLKIWLFLKNYLAKILFYKFKKIIKNNYLRFSYKSTPRQTTVHFPYHNSVSNYKLEHSPNFRCFYNFFCTYKLICRLKYLNIPEA